MPILVAVDRKQEIILKIDPYLRRLFRLFRPAGASAPPEIGDQPSILYLCLWNNIELD